jgi:flagellar hook-associated protein 2
MTTTISSSATSGAITTQGIGSGLDIASIVDKLVSVASQPLTDLQTQESAYETKLSAFGQVSSALSTFQSTIAPLTTPAAFQTFAATIGDSSIASVAVSSTNSNSLSAGSHTLTVSQLADSQRTASSAFADTTSAIGTGTITIDVGTWNSSYSSFTPNGTVGSKTITIDSTNDSLSGIRDAINAAGAGVTASIVNDGTGNRLVLTGSSTGSANGFRVSTSDSDGNNLDASGLSQIAFDPSASGGTPQTQHLSNAVNANFTIDGLAISKPSNTVTDAISGLTIGLNQVNTTGTSFTIARDTSSATTAISNFVSAYNTIASGIATLTNYDASSGTAGTLNGDSTTRLISTRLQSLIATVVPTGGTVTDLNDLGITFGSDGQLTLDSTKLASALASDPNSVSKVFAKTGTVTDSLVSYSDSTDATQSGSHALTVSQLATQGTLTGAASAGLTITAGVNDSLSVTLDNVNSTITIPPGTYSDASSLAAAVQSQINGTSAFSTVGSSVNVSASGGVLSFTSNRYGSASSVTLGGNAASGLVGSAPASTTGLDVAGTLDGVAFNGAGQTAIGATGSSAEGLKLSITGGTTGSRGTVTLTRGIAASINDTLTQVLDPTNGLLTSATAGLNSSITDVKAQEDAWTPRLDAIRAQYTAQYNAMDALVASLNSTGSYLTQQLTAISAQINNENK